MSAGEQVPNAMDEALGTERLVQPAISAEVIGELRRRGLCAMKVSRVAELQRLEALVHNYVGAKEAGAVCVTEYEELKGWTPGAV